MRFYIKLSLIILTYFLILFISSSNQNELNIVDASPTSRRLLLFGGIQLSLGKKKSNPTSSSSIKSLNKNDETRVSVYFQPQTSAELGKTIRSYSYLLKNKIYSKSEREKLKKELKQKQKQKPNKKNKKSTINEDKNKKNQTATKLVESKIRDLVPVDENERDRCRALLSLEEKKTRNENTLSLTTKENPKKSKGNSVSQEKLKKAKLNTASQEKPKLNSVPQEKPKNTKENSVSQKKPKNTKENSVTQEKPKQPKENSAPQEKPKNTKENSVPQEKAKQPKENSVPQEKAKKNEENSVSQEKQQKTKISSATEEKRNPTSSSRQTVSPPVQIEDSIKTDVDYDDNVDDQQKNNSVVGRAFFFVKNIFQLSDDNLESNQTIDDESVSEQHHQSRKLLSVDSSSIVFKEFTRTLLPTRHLLAVKNEKKRSNPTTQKPKVGWAYRYRISRYFSAQKSKKNGRNLGGGKNSKKEFSKRKLLTFDSNEENCDGKAKNDENEKKASFLQSFVPKRKLLGSKKSSEKSSKKKISVESETENEDENDENPEKDEKQNERRRKKSFEELTDPMAIVKSYDQGLFKPRVGWQFRYRVSRYIDSLRENIREDHERLKLGLEAIKRKTPQELSGRRKRVLDKPFTAEEETTVQQENKPNVGWRYRYRISKMLEAKQRGEYIDDEEEKRKNRLETKNKNEKFNENDEDCLEWENDLDPELRKIGEEGRRVGWTYRYRIRRRLDELKQKQTETGIPFDWETLNLGGKREKIVQTTSTTTEMTEIEEKNKKLVGWKYRYRVSKMLEAQEKEEAENNQLGSSRKAQTRLDDENLDPELAKLTPEQKVVGWAFRYRIRRKLETIKNATRQNEAGKRSNEKLSKRKRKEKIIKKVEESIEKILNIDDIDETPFMEYFRRTSTYVFSGLVPTARKSICLLPLPVNLAFCTEDENVETEDFQPEISSSERSNPVTEQKKERVKKEKRAASTPRVTETPVKTTTQKTPVKTVTEKSPVKTVTEKTPVKTTTEKVSVKTTTEKTPVKQTNERILKKPNSEPVRPPPNKRRVFNENIKHFDEEEEPIKKRVGVESSKRKTKKQFQILGQEVRVKTKSVTTTTTTTTTTTAEQTPPPPPTTTTVAPPVQSSPPPETSLPPTEPKVSRVKKPKTTTTTTTPAPETTTTTTTEEPTTLPPLSELNHEEASTVLSVPTIQVEEVAEISVDAEEENQSDREDNDETDDDESESTNTEQDETSEDEDEDQDEDEDEEDSTSEEPEDKKENFDPLALKKLKKYYENAKASVHDVFDLKDEQNE